MATKGFTKIDNSIIFDSNLSLEAIGLYVKLKYLSSIPDFKIKRDHIKSISGYGETAFRRVWKELKDKEILIENKLRVSGRYEFIFTLKNSEVSKKKSKNLIEEELKKPKDSDGNTPLEGQLSIDDVLEEISLDKIQLVTNETEFNEKQVKELLRVADVRTIINYFRYVKSKGEEIKNIFSYTKKLIVDKIDIVKHKATNKFSSFNNYQQREYTKEQFISMEWKLLGWGEPSEVY